MLKSLGAGAIGITGKSLAEVIAIAQEAGSGRVLMAAHMNAEALRLTIETGEVHYYSRSRKALWKKGETSGEVQKLMRAETGSTSVEALLFTSFVTQ